MEKLRFLAQDFSGVLSVVISVVLFWITYKQTIGAKAERIISSNAELEKILLRRIVLENYIPTKIDILRLIESKARDFRVRDIELLSETQILDIVYARILESDLIPSDQRKILLEKINPILVGFELAPLEEHTVEEVKATKRILRMSQIIPVYIGLGTSIAGGIISLIPFFKGVDTTVIKAIPEFIATIATSFAIVIVLLKIVRLKAPQEDMPSKAKEITKYYNFEERVYRTLKNAGIVVKLSGPRDEGFDFFVAVRDKNYLIEVKSWSKSVGKFVIARTIERLRESANRIGVNESIIVVDDPYIKKYSDINMEGISIMTLGELMVYFKRNNI